MKVDAEHYETKIQRTDRGLEVVVMVRVEEQLVTRSYPLELWTRHHLEDAPATNDKTMMTFVGQLHRDVFRSGPDALAYRLARQVDEIIVQMREEAIKQGWLEEDAGPIPYPEEIHGSKEERDARR